MHFSKLMIYHLICTNLIKFSLEYSKISTIIQHPGVVVRVHLFAVLRARQPRRVTVHRAAHGRLRPRRPWKNSGIQSQKNIIFALFYWMEFNSMLVQCLISHENDNKYADECVWERFGRDCGVEGSRVEEAEGAREVHVSGRRWKREIIMPPHMQIVCTFVCFCGTPLTQCRRQISIAPKEVYVISWLQFF